MMQHRNRVAFLAALVGLLVFVRTGVVSAVVPPYDNLTQRQNEFLEDGRTALDLTLDLTAANEFALRQQAVALIAELEAQARGLGTPSATEAQADLHLRGIVDRLAVVMGMGGGPILYTNRMIAYDASYFTAYLLHRYPLPWTLGTLGAAHALYRDSIIQKPWPQGAWNTPSDLLGDHRAACTGMRLLAGEVFDDQELFDFARSEIFRTRARIARGAHAQMQPHYTGQNITELLLMLEVDDSEIHGVLQDMLEWVLLLPAHLYLPGGGLGAPKNRTKGGGGGIVDPSPLDAAKLISKINMLIFDPDLTAGADPVAAATDYAVPEIIRSVFLDKEDGYTFWLNEKNHTDPQPGAPEEHLYPLGWQGWEGGPIGPMGVKPWQVEMLPGGIGSIGVKYGSDQSGRSVSSGVYTRTPAAAPAFSILFHYQKDWDEANPGIDPPDPQWHFERETPWRRMQYGRTALTLWDTTFPEAPQLEYTQAHVPDFSDPDVGTASEVFPSSLGAQNQWYVGQSGDAYVAYLPLGNVVEETHTPAAAGETQDWTFIRIDGPISGNITELATTSEYPTLADYKLSLQNRFLAYAGTSAADAAIEFDVVVDASTVPETTRRIRLEYAPEQRLVDGVAQPDDQFLPLHENMRSPWVTWDDSQFSLTVQRTGYTTRVLDFGDPTFPTAPHGVVDETPAGPSSVQLRWEHGWDDVAITAYRIYEDDDEIDTVPGSVTAYDYTPPDDGTGLTHTVQYSIEAIDAAGNVSPSRGRTIAVEVPGDGDPPSVPQGLSAAANRLVWQASTDNSGVVAGYEILRDGAVIATTTELEFLDGGQSPNTLYVYTVTAFDAQGNTSDESEPASVTTGTDVQAPTATTIQSGFANHLGSYIDWTPSTDDVGVASYDVTRDGTFVGSTTQNFYFDVTVQQGATHQYRVRAYDAAGNTSPESPAFPLYIPDVEPPTAPTTFTAEQWQSFPIVVLAWSGATDNYAVEEYEVFRDGVLVATLPDEAWFEAVAPGVSYSYTVRALDAAGNASPQTAPVVVDVQ